MNKVSLALVVFVLASLACSITPSANYAAMVTATPSPSPPPPSPSPAPTEKAQDISTQYAVCTVTAGSLHLRAMPGTSAEVIGYLYAGDVLTILPDPPAESWIRVTAGDLTGWINSNYCTKGITP